MDVNGSHGAAWRFFPPRHHHGPQLLTLEPQQLNQRSAIRQSLGAL